MVEGEGVGGAGVVSLVFLLLLLEEEEVELLASLVELAGASEVVLPPAGERGRDGELGWTFIVEYRG